jgi:hypothetical protein
MFSKLECLFGPFVLHLDIVRERSLFSKLEYLFGPFVLHLDIVRERFLQWLGVTIVDLFPYSRSVR